MTGKQGIAEHALALRRRRAQICGFCCELHRPNGGLLTVGCMSLMVAASWESALAEPRGGGQRCAFAPPMLHWSFAPCATSALPCQPYFDRRTSAR